MKLLKRVKEQEEEGKTINYFEKLIVDWETLSYLSSSNSE